MQFAGELWNVSKCEKLGCRRCHGGVVTGTACTVLERAAERVSIVEANMIVVTR